MLQFSEKSLRSQPIELRDTETSRDASTLSLVVSRIIDFCTLHVWLVIIASVFVTAVAGTYAVRHFAINTDIQRLISPDLSWRKREVAYQSVFPQGMEMILAVVEAPTPEATSAAAAALQQRLSQRTDLFRTVDQSGGGPFFERNRFLFLPTEDVGRISGQMSRASPLMGTLAADPSIRGLVQALSLALTGARVGQLSLNDLARPFDLVAETVENILAGRPARFSWYVMVNGHPATQTELRRFVMIRPVLDFNALEPGKQATDAIRAAAQDLDLASEFGADVRLTGPVPIADEEFGTLREGALLNAAVTIGVVLFILWLALRSARIIVAVSLNLVVGLAITAAVGLLMVGALNLISIAFAVLFVGLGVDFGIQFSVRYRDERHTSPDLRNALISAGKRAGAPLTLAAAATAAGFLSFLPTDYRGLSELGQIAGTGMVIAFLTSITVLPALLKLLNPPGEIEPLGYAMLAPVDRFLERHRIPVIVITLVVAVGLLPSLLYLRFDFNPMNLRDTNAESVSTYLRLLKDPNTGAHTAQVLAPSVSEASATAKRLAGLPVVARTMTIESFIPQEQDKKLASIRTAANALKSPLNPSKVRPAPNDAETIAALRSGAQALQQAAARGKGDPGVAAARRLADDLSRLADADVTKRTAAAAVFTRPLVSDLSELRTALQATPVNRDSLPPSLVRDWVAPDGRARVDVTPKGDLTDNETIRTFAREVLAAEPNASGEAIGILESGQTVVRAFILAGACALGSIAVLLWFALRRFTDVLLTLVPLVLAGVVTLEICALIEFPLNFANIIALPLLLGVGVAFKIYYVMAWRAGQTNLLQSSLTRAVVFSALTTATAFGSLWFSSHPGTSSMGKLLALALLTTMAAAVLFQPALMGRPRDADKVEGIKI